MVLMIRHRSSFALNYEEQAPVLYLISFKVFDYFGLIYRLISTSTDT